MAIFWRGFTPDISQGGGFQAAIDLFTSANFLWLVGNSISVSLRVAVITVPLAYLFAYALHRTLILLNPFCGVEYHYYPLLAPFYATGYCIGLSIW